MVAYHESGGLDGSFERSAIEYDKANRERSEKAVTIRRDTANGALQTYTTFIRNTYTGGLLTEQYQDAYKGAINASGGQCCARQPPDL